MAKNKKQTAAQTKNPLRPLIVIAGIIFVLVTAIVLLNNAQNETATDIVFSTHPDTSNQPTIGNVDAAVSVVEFADYKCPACRHWSETVFPQLKEDYIDTGKISFSYVNVLFHGDESFLGGLAARAIWHQDPEAFWDFNKALFKEQPPVQNHDDPWITVEKIIEVAEKAVPHLDLVQLEEDIIAMTYKDDVLLDNELVVEYDIQLTPSIIVNGTMLDNPFDYENLKKLIEGGLTE